MRHVLCLLAELLLLSGCADNVSLFEAAAKDKQQILMLMWFTGWFTYTRNCHALFCFLNCSRTDWKEVICLCFRLQ